MKSEKEYSLLPSGKTFSQSLFPFALPYFAYVGLGSLPATILSPEAIGALKIGLVLAILWYFRKEYRFGPKLMKSQIPLALGAGVLATVIWIAVLRFSLELPFWNSQLLAASSQTPSMGVWVFRALGSVLLVPVFEELLCRGYLGEYFNAVPKGTGVGEGGGAGGFFTRLGQPLDLKPPSLTNPPRSAQAILGSTLFFTVGHNPSAWPAAILYFLFTSWVYAKTQSFQICMIMHAIANLSIALLVLWRPEMHFLW